ncbi:sensor histidine kinase [Microlunatus panaciterrae]|uniref:MEDS domain-containing protein n=1 Tax=Microlunatus panaciterrae TaxID=400768 RepID=A0ABS2RK68_9ACTN|nr:sensor histidine kinase [Microlunatus panaciterrae]MBM7799409.1 hypothetical protein [Microlunatus panaciterrae]
MAMTSAVRPQHSYRHEAFLWHTPEEFLAGTVPFIRDGLASGEPVMVALISVRADLLRNALGGDADQVRFVDMAALGRNPAQIIPAWMQFLEDGSVRGRPARGIGEPIWAGRRPEEILESQLHEALLNVAVDPDTPFWLLCPYDAENLPAAVIEEAHRSHPAIVDSHGYRGSVLYAGRAHVDVVFGSELPGISGVPEERRFDSKSLQEVLPFVATRAHRGGVPAHQAASLAVAVRELAANSLQRGGAEGVVRFWHANHAVIFEVHDDARVSDPLAGRRWPSADQRKGLWLANETCDLVQLRSTPTGTTVRVHHWT